MRHRHLDVPAGTPPDQLGAAAIDDLLDRGDLDDWTPLARAVAADPWGPTLSWGSSTPIRCTGRGRSGARGSAGCGTAAPAPRRSLPSGAPPA